MKTDVQREALAVLAEIWELSPDVRLGQLFAHLGFLGVQSDFNATRSQGRRFDDNPAAGCNRIQV